MIDRDAENDCLAAYCHNGSVSAVFMNSLLGSFSHDARKDRRRLVEYHDAGGPYIHDNRSRIARYFLEHTDYQWLWFLDNDVQFEPDTLDRLLETAESLDLKILAAAYWNQYVGTACYLSWLVFTNEGIKAMPNLPDPARFPVVELTAAGMGCTLIHRDALQDVADCYPNDPWDTFAADILVRFTDGTMQVGRSPEDIQPNGREIKSVDRMGEDVTFCLRARKCDHVTYGLPSVTVEHFKPHFMVHGAPPKASIEVPKLVVAR